MKYATPAVVAPGPVLSVGMIAEAIARSSVCSVTFRVRKAACESTLPCRLEACEFKLVTWLWSEVTCPLALVTALWSEEICPFALVSEACVELNWLLRPAFCELAALSELCALLRELWVSDNWLLSAPMVL
jgi:hypothetical protein